MSKCVPTIHPGHSCTSLLACPFFHIATNGHNSATRPVLVLFMDTLNGHWTPEDAFLQNVETTHSATYIMSDNWPSTVSHISRIYIGERGQNKNKFARCMSLLRLIRLLKSLVILSWQQCRRSSLHTACVLTATS
jgi:hypothetical protein